MKTRLIGDPPGLHRGVGLAAVCLDRTQLALAEQLPAVKAALQLDGTLCHLPCVLEATGRQASDAEALKAAPAKPAAR